MYRPRHFAVDDDALIAELLNEASFGHLVVVDGAEIHSTPMPFSVVTGDDAGAGGPACGLRGHLSRANPFWQLAADGPVPVLVIVTTVDGYVSPGWYESKREHGRVVPTWNYEVVHVRGRLTVSHDRAWLRELVTELTDRHEAGRHEAGGRKPWAVTDAPAEFIDRQLDAIVGVEISIENVEAKRKLSQNRSAADQAGVRSGLAASGHPGAAALAAATQRPPTG